MVETDRERRHTAEVVTATDTPALLRRVSWGAIFAGTFIALGLMALLGMMGAAIGFRAIDPQQSDAFNGIGIGAAIWWVITSIVALGIGGYAAGRLSGLPDKSAATAHGASVWGVVTIVTLWFATGTIGTVMNTAVGAVSTTAQAAASVVGSAGQAAVAPNSPVDVNEAELRGAAQDVIQAARQRADQINVDRARAQVAQGGEDALDALSTVAWYAFCASLLSLGAAVLGAGAGAPKHTFMAATEKVDI